MIGRENRVILGSFRLLVPAFVGLSAVDRFLGVVLYQSPLPLLPLIAGLVIVVP